MAMRRRFLLAAVAAPLAALFAAHGCSGEQPFESACLWVADPTNCYRKFHADAVANGNDCKPFGDPTPATFGGSPGTANGSFGNRAMLDICLIGGGGQIILDPPIDLTTFPPSPDASPVTRKFTFKLPDGTQCGNATYTSPHGFSFTINPPPDSGAPPSADAGGSSSADAGAATAPVPYGTYTEYIAPGREAFDVTCPTGESHHFNLVEVSSSSDGVDGGAVSSCPLFKDIVPRAIFVIDPGGVSVPGAVSFSIVWPPDTGPYPSSATLQSGTPVVPQTVTYFNCTIPGSLPLCMNGIKDGSETDKDCGGTEVSTGCPARCQAGQGCITSCDCDPSMVCMVNTGVRQCGVLEAGAPPPRDCSSSIICQDKKQDGAETDIDCGGNDCTARCKDLQKCKIGSDCMSGFCFANLCQTPNCGDSKKDLGETDVDCGGPKCKPCVDGKTCVGNTDCTSGNCIAGVCKMSTCTDGHKNGSETDVDCGGACPKCTNLKACLVNADCVNDACVPVDGGLACVFPSCSDMVQDGTETDKDCGGSCATINGLKCADGLLCKVAGDCLSGLCGAASVSQGAVTDRCFPTSCFIDAGVSACGGACPLCNDGGPCSKNSDCLHNGCILSASDAGSGTCQTPTCSDNTMDGNETDKDCGGNVCAPCLPGQMCQGDSDCGGTLKKCINKVCQ